MSLVAYEFPEDEEQIPDQQQEEQRPTEAEPVDRTAKATKNDDAEIPVEIRMKFLEKGLPGKVKARDWKPHLEVLRRFWLRQYHRMIYKTTIKWIKKTQARGMVVTPEALDSIREGLYRVTQASWWEWRAGSTPFFSRWTDEFQDRIRDGIKLWISGRLTPFKRAQKGNRDPVKKTQVLQKLDKIRKRGYVEAGYVESLISFLDVEKGSDDIRMF
jgi:hypothetical protein